MTNPCNYDIQPWIRSLWIHDYSSIKSAYLHAKKKNSTAQAGNHFMFLKIDNADKRTNLRRAVHQKTSFENTKGQIEMTKRA